MWSRLTVQLSANTLRFARSSSGQRIQFGIDGRSHATDVLGTRSSLARQRHKKKDRYANYHYLTDNHVIGPLSATKATINWLKAFDTNQNIFLLRAAPTNVRYASNSDGILQPSETLARRVNLIILPIDTVIVGSN